MEKPITVIRQEFAETLTELINKTPLPAFVMAEVVGGLAAQLKALSWEQYQADAAAYKKAETEASA